MNLKWTGWKKLPGKNSYVSQIILFDDDGQRMHWVNLPNMAVGTAMIGGVMDVYWRNGYSVPWQVDDTAKVKMVSDGLHRLIDYVLSPQSKSSLLSNCVILKRTTDSDAQDAMQDEDYRSFSDEMIAAGLAIHP